MTTLFAISGKNIKGVRELTEAEVSKYDAAFDAINAFQRTEQIFELVCGNHDAFHDHVSHERTSLRGVRASHGAMRAHQALALRINRHLVNYLGSARLYLDNYELRLKRAYGKGSREVASFKSETAQSYDGSFAYRFLYRLRNYGQHFGLPIGGIDAHASTDRPGGVPRYHLTVCFDARALALDPEQA